MITPVTTFLVFQKYVCRLRAMLVLLYMYIIWDGFAITNRKLERDLTKSKWFYLFCFIFYSCIRRFRQFWAGTAAQCYHQELWSFDIPILSVGCILKFLGLFPCDVKVAPSNQAGNRWKGQEQRVVFSLLFVKWYPFHSLLANILDQNYILWLFLTAGGW